MKTIAHLSDIHFGAIDTAIIEPLVTLLSELAPDLIAVSGDLTQRAKTAQFIAAKAFLDRLPQPQIVVPGNHDVPFYNIFRRFARPLEKYRRYITDDLLPFYADDEIAVAGINTARSLTIKGGRINEEQIASLRVKLSNLGENTAKIVVTHHPFDLPAGNLDSDIVGRAPLAMKTLAECRVDVFLAGHMHIMHTGHTAVRYKVDGHSALVIQAGTATSTRHRGEENSFNVIRVDGGNISIERFVWQPAIKKFVVGTTEKFYLVGGIWRPEGNI